MLSDFSPQASNLDFLKTSDESNAVKLYRTLGPGMWFDCDKHSSQNLEYFLVCDIFYNDSRHSFRFDKWLGLPSDVSCDVRSGVRRHEEETATISPVALSHILPF